MVSRRSLFFLCCVQFSIHIVFSATSLSVRFFFLIEALTVLVTPLISATVETFFVPIGNGAVADELCSPFFPNSSKKVALIKPMGYYAPVRVCDNCHLSLEKAAPSGDDASKRQLPFVGREKIDPLTLANQFCEQDLDGTNAVITGVGEFAQQLAAVMLKKQIDGLRVVAAIKARLTRVALSTSPSPCSLFVRQRPARRSHRRQKHCGAIASRRCV